MEYRERLEQVLKELDAVYDEWGETVYQTHPGEAAAYATDPDMERARYALFHVRRAVTEVKTALLLGFIEPKPTEWERIEDARSHPERGRSRPVRRRTIFPPWEEHTDG